MYYIRHCSIGYCRVELSQFEGVGLDGQDDCLRVTIAIAGTLVAHSVSIGSILPPEAGLCGLETND